MTHKCYKVYKDKKTGGLYIKIAKTTLDYENDKYYFFDVEKCLEHSKK